MNALEQVIPAEAMVAEVTVAVGQKHDGKWYSLVDLMLSTGHVVSAEKGPFDTEAEANRECVLVGVVLAKIGEQIQ